MPMCAENNIILDTNSLITVWISHSNARQAGDSSTSGNRIKRKFEKQNPTADLEGHLEALTWVYRSGFDL